ncbi:hypothetical protein [Leifsonia sp. NPDC077715]|uniref:hypothetical protein n=1 Tax=Leifsonia sp. NPDC077715 TaxID=3155539 RepID=UPI0034366DFB
MSYTSYRAHQVPGNLADAIAGIEKGLESTAEAARAAIDALLHNAAVGLLHSALPPMVHGRNALVRSGAWMRAEALTAELGLSLTGARVGKAVLSGAVAEAIDKGLDMITKDLDYTPGVNSIT